MKPVTTIATLAIVLSANAAPTTIPTESDTGSPNPSAALKRQHPYQHSNECGPSTFTDKWHANGALVNDCLTMVEKQTQGYYETSLFEERRLLTWGTCAFSARLYDPKYQEFPSVLVAQCGG
ncbi:hypothetical protein B0T14DRAFT_501103 [Immersiella caudata]|uniref:Ecp2 effector protein-like domain-containing protein n=1 Tax=Immersiella caudata TaxID=314043 RepID=A0AA39TLZ9_9PEZI|nr:hypothetical protein B0T14DRAFT_501103 [Immersiella caudata]